MVLARAARFDECGIQGANRLGSPGAGRRAPHPGQDSGGDASVRRFAVVNTVNQLRVLGRWMRMFTIPNQSSVPKAFLEFDEHDRMKPSALYDRVVDVMEELVKFTVLLRDRPDLVDRYSERKESADELSQRVNQRSI